MQTKELLSIKHWGISWSTLNVAAVLSAWWICYEQNNSVLTQLLLFIIINVFHTFLFCHDSLPPWWLWQTVLQLWIMYCMYLENKQQKKTWIMNCESCSTKSFVLTFQSDESLLLLKWIFLFLWHFSYPCSIRLKQQHRSSFYSCLRVVVAIETARHLVDCNVRVTVCARVQKESFEKKSRVMTLEIISVHLRHAGSIMRPADWNSSGVSG